MLFQHNAPTTFGVRGIHSSCGDCCLKKLTKIRNEIEIDPEIEDENEIEIYHALGNSKRSLQSASLA